MASKQVRLTPENERELTKAVKGTICSVPKAANEAIKLGLSKLLRKLGKAHAR